VVGAPGEDLGATIDVGVVNVFFGAAAGLTTSQTLRQDNPEAGDQFGAALIAEFFDVPWADLVVGAPGENVGATVDAGAVNLFSDTAGMLPAVSGPALLQDNPEAGDRFGAALTVKFLNGSAFLDLMGGRRARMWPPRWMPGRSTSSPTPAWCCRASVARRWRRPMSRSVTGLARPSTPD
jgi:hypothetical protein